MRKTAAILILVLLSGLAQAQELQVGDKAPEIVMQSVDGKEIRLSNLHGQMVLIDFWASWCRPCRKENPNIVRAYQEYKEDTFKNGAGFTVLSVSLDTKQESWKKAIEMDGLVWEHHVSDLQGWKNAAAQQYKVMAIPHSYLIDGDGIIVAVNPRGSALETSLKKQLKSKGLFKK